MLFSVVIPLYNAEAYIRECLNSILNQTYNDFEIVVIDDGSIDSSFEIVEEYEKKDTRIKLIQTNHMGVTVARQLGVGLSHGEYILFVDADDTINSELLFNIKNAINEFPDVEMIRFRCNMINDKSCYDHELYNDYNSEYNVLYDGIEAIRRWTKPKKRYEIFWLYAIKRENTLNIYDCPNLTTSGDYACMPLIIANCKKILKIEYIGYNYTCDNLNSLTRSIGEERDRIRTLNFINAYKYLMKEMHIIEEQTGEDLQFFYDEWKQRLLKRYNRISDTLKAEFKVEFEKALNQ